MDHQTLDPPSYRHRRPRSGQLPVPKANFFNLEGKEIHLSQLPDEWYGGYDSRRKAAPADDLAVSLAAMLAGA